jgi:hypothetical protein
MLGLTLKRTDLCSFSLLSQGSSQCFSKLGPPFFLFPLDSCLRSSICSAQFSFSVSAVLADYFFRVDLRDGLALLDVFMVPTRSDCSCVKASVFLAQIWRRGPGARQLDCICPPTLARSRPFLWLSLEALQFWLSFFNFARDMFWIIVSENRYCS